MKLNKIQKVFMAIMGLAIFVFQMYKFSEDGIEGYSWIFSMLASVCLILPSMGGTKESDDGENDNKLKKDKGSALSKEELEKLEKLVSPLITRVMLESTLLLTHIYSILNVSPKENIERVAIMGLMMDQWRIYCIAYVYALSCICENYKDQGFIGSMKYKLFKLRTIDQMVKVSSESAEKNKIGIEFIPESAKKWAIKDIDDAETALNNMIINFEKKLPSPDVVMVEYLCEKMKIPSDIKVGFVKEIRGYTRSLLSEMKKN